MTSDQYLIASIIFLSMIFFIRGWPRYDIVALSALLLATVTGLVPVKDAFLGFGHPAVITVASVLVISRALRNSGAVDIFANLIKNQMTTPARQSSSLLGSIAIASSFMNNVGALAILMPVGIETAMRKGFSIARLLMPLSFAAILGGLVTMIGTPPNIIVATVRAEETGQSFTMFDFAPVGLPIALIGILYLLTIGWRLVPHKRRGITVPEQLFEIRDYMTEVRVPQNAPANGQTLAQLPHFTDREVIVSALIRGEERRPAPGTRTRLRTDDILVLRGDPTELAELLEKSGLQLALDLIPQADDLRSKDIALLEFVVGTSSRMIGRSASNLHLWERYRVNLLAIAREGERVRTRMDRVLFKAGDVLLVQGDATDLNDELNELGCLPLAQRSLRLGQPRRVILAIGIFGTSLIATGFGLIPAALSLAMAATAMVLTGLIATRDLYESIDWPIIILLGAMLPIGNAFETSGLASVIANNLVGTGSEVPSWILLAGILIITMTLSDIMNNAATALVMAPIGIGIAEATGGSVDSYLMAVAVGASCAFLTPIGHQNNTLVMGPGGYHFSDYWRVGLPLEILIITLAVPLITFFWG